MAEPALFARDASEVHDLVSLVKVFLERFEGGELIGREFQSDLVRGTLQSHEDDFSGFAPIITVCSPLRC